MSFPGTQPRNTPISAESNYNHNQTNSRGKQGRKGGGGGLLLTDFSQISSLKLPAVIVKTKLKVATTFDFSSKKLRSPLYTRIMFVLLTNNQSELDASFSISI